MYNKLSITLVRIKHQGVIILDLNNLADKLKTSFPKCSIDIKESMELLQSCLEDTIDTIEDKANKIVKEDRNFVASNQYRKLSEEVYEIILLLKEYGEKLEENADDERIPNDIDENNQEDEGISKNHEGDTDTNIEHSLYEDFKYRKPYAFQLGQTKKLVSDWSEMFIETAELLAKMNPEIIYNFPKDPRMNGKKINYFSYNAKPFSGSMVKLKNVDIYVKTQCGSNRVRNIIILMLRKYNITVDSFKVYVATDYSI
jgi:uncharacterized protein YeeX (DUF496 family)